jgi:CheY-like chemotaxis protein
VGADQKTKILIVDDCAEMTVLLKAFLSDPSIEIAIADSGRQGLEMFKTGKFDLVFLDIEMPGMDGYEAGAAMRRFEREHARAKTPIMALTAASDIKSSYKILSAGFDLHVVKPISRVTLLQIVGQFRRKIADNGPTAATETVARQQLQDHLYSFIEKRNEDFLKLQSATREQNYNSAQQLGSLLKSVGSSFGLDFLAMIGLQIESAATAHQPDALERQVQEYGWYVQKLREEKQAVAIS